MGTWKKECVWCVRQKEKRSGYHPASGGARNARRWHGRMGDAGWSMFTVRLPAEHIPAAQSWRLFNLKMWKQQHQQESKTRAPLYETQQTPGKWSRKQQWVLFFTGRRTAKTDLSPHTSWWVHISIKKINAFQEHLNVFDERELKCQDELRF